MIERLNGKCAPLEKCLVNFVPKDYPRYLFPKYVVCDQYMGET